jgi:hypothetical protein
MHHPLDFSGKYALTFYRHAGINFQCSAFEKKNKWYKLECFANKTNKK